MKHLSSRILIAIILLFSLTNIPVKAHTHIFTDWEVVEKPTCDSDGEKFRTCKECAYEEWVIIPKTKHKWGSWKIIKKSTPFRTGLKERECSFCYKTEKRNIPKRKFNKKERKILAPVLRYLRSAKKYNWKKMDKCFAKKPKDYGFPTAKKCVKAYKKWNKKYLSYKIKNIKKRGNKYIIYVKVTRPDFYWMIHDALYDQTVYAWEHNTDGYKAGIKAGKIIERKLQYDPDETDTSIVKIPVIKRKGKWLIQCRNATVSDIATGFWNEALDDAAKDFERDLENGEL